MQQRVKLVFNLAGRRSGKLRREQLEGRTHLVVPCTMLVEGVVEGSGGPLLYLNEESGKDLDAWNHMPVVVYHPKKEGNLTSAKHPDVVNTSKIGVLFNTTLDGKLNTEVWCDEERTKEVDPRVHEAIVNEQPMEVSTGLGMDIEPTAGEFNGKKYKGIARNYRPDHLAILPDQKGACSIADGAGLYANSSVEKPTENELWIGNEAGTAVVNDKSLQQTMSQVAQALYEKFQKPGYSWNGWVEDVFDGYVVYYTDRKLWSVNYKTTDGKVEISGEPTEVVRVVQYKKVSGDVIGNSESWQFVPYQEKSPMAAPAGFDKKAHVTSLIGNGWTEEDRAFLEGLPDEKLAKVTPKATAPAVPPPTLNPTPAPAPVANTVPTAALTPEQANLFRKLLANEANRKKSLIERIVNAQAGLNLQPSQRFSPEFLVNKEVEELEAWVVTVESATSVAAQAADPYAGMFQGSGGYEMAPSYAGAAGGPPVVGNAARNDRFVCNEEPPIMPTLDFTEHNPNRK